MHEASAQSCALGVVVFPFFHLPLGSVGMCGGVTPPQQPQDIRGRRPGLTHNRRVGEIIPILMVLQYWEGCGAPHGSVMGWGGLLPAGLGYPPLLDSIAPLALKGHVVLSLRRGVPRGYPGHLFLPRLPLSPPLRSLGGGCEVPHCLGGRSLCLAWLEHQQRLGMGFQTRVCVSIPVKPVAIRICSKDTFEPRARPL